MPCPCMHVVVAAVSQLTLEEDADFLGVEFHLEKRDKRGWGRRMAVGKLSMAAPGTGTLLTHLLIWGKGSKSPLHSSG